MSIDLIARAAQILRNGGLVAFPTETVYGLGGDATNPSAVRRIFQAKGRPSTNPLIVHVADVRVAQRYAMAWPATAERLATRFWPGPLTLVLPRLLLRPARIGDEVTAGRATIALRVPAHPVALELLKRFDGAVAAPSANRSTRVSPTTARHVLDEMGASVDLILDGGACRVGIESTVLDLSEATPRILRPGQVSREQIEREIGRVSMFQGVADPASPAVSPGQQAVHYAPRAAAYRFEHSQVAEVEAQCRGRAGDPIAFLFMGGSQAAALPDEEDGGSPGGRFVMPGRPVDYARELYRVLRQLDDHSVREIWIEMPPDSPEWAAVRDRILRATSAWDAT